MLTLVNYLEPFFNCPLEILWVTACKCNTLPFYVGRILKWPFVLCLVAPHIIESSNSAPHKYLCVIGYRLCLYHLEHGSLIPSFSSRKGHKYVFLLHIADVVLSGEESYFDLSKRVTCTRRPEAYSELFAGVIVVATVLNRSFICLQ